MRSQPERGDYDIQAYIDTYYSTPSPTDGQILVRLAEFHAALPSGGTMIEVGAGPNLFPLLAAAPFRSAVLVTDISHRPLEYVRRQIDAPALDANWCAFTQILASKDGRYDDPGEIVNRLRRICSFGLMSVLDLPEGGWDCCSSHFVLHAISSSDADFELACGRVVRSVRPGGGFAVSLMLGSAEYALDGVRHSCVDVTADWASEIFRSEAASVSCHVFDGPESIIRSGHTGQMLIVGRR